jgi:hypothetical protein
MVEIRKLRFKEMENKAIKDNYESFYQEKSTVTCINSCAIEGEISTAFE